jgi:lysophospholipid acyltransferase (LPLAT)-like uncharacterized protein
MMIAKFNGFFLFLFSELVVRTCRFYIVGFEDIDPLELKGKSIILTSWHGMTMMVIGLIRKKFDIKSFIGIMPDDHRGASLREFGRHVGVEGFALNLAGDETMSIGRRLVEVIRRLSSGNNMVLHPDGPAGPAYKIKPGLTFLAKKSGAVILPLGCYCRHSYHMPRWDRYTLPLPFSKVHIQIGKPIHISKDLKDLTESNLKLTDTLNRLSSQASANYYEL